MHCFGVKMASSCMWLVSFETRGKIEDMTDSSVKKLRLHRVTSLAIFVLYLSVSTFVDLFHTENCVFVTQRTGTTNGIFSTDQCPACKFLAGHNSTQVSHEPALLNAERLFISQLLPHSDIVHSNEWASSITPRAPPLTSIS